MSRRLELTLCADQTNNQLFSLKQMPALWLIKVQTSKKQLQEVSKKPFIAVVSLCPCFIKTCAMLPSACWWVWTPCCVCFSVVRELQDAVSFSHHHFNGFRCLQESMCPTFPIIQRDTVRNLQKMTQIKPVVPYRKQKQSVTNILTGHTWKWLWDLREELKCKENSRE